MKIEEGILPIEDNLQSITFLVPCDTNEFTVCNGNFFDQLNKENYRAMAGKCPISMVMSNEGEVDIGGKKVRLRIRGEYCDNCDFFNPVIAF